jgi:hypothetical protein
MTPIEKNICVIDESGNEYEATYPKRADGLVKKGRARFVDNKTICLNNTSVPACPAGINEPENKKMDNNISLNDNKQKQSTNDFVREQINRMMSLLETTNPDGEPYMMVNVVMFDKVNSMMLTFMEHSNEYDETPEEPSMKYVMSRIDMIIRDNQHIKSALTAIDTMQINESLNGGVGDAARAEAIQNTVQSRETTNQKILEILDKMYDDLKPRQTDIKETMLQGIIEATSGAGPFTEERISLIEKFSELLENLRHVNH